MRKCGELGPHHFVDGERRHLACEGFLGVNAFRPHIVVDVLVDALQVGQLLVEMARQKQRAVGELAFGSLQRPITDLQHQIGAADRNRDDKRDAAKNQPLNRPHPGTERQAVDPFEPAPLKK